MITDQRLAKFQEDFLKMTPDEQTFVHASMKVLIDIRYGRIEAAIADSFRAVFEDVKAQQSSVYLIALLVEHGYLPRFA